MSQHGTAFPDWYITFQQAVLAALPRPPKLEKDIGLGWADNGGALMKVLAEALLPQAEEIYSTVASSVLVYPADGEIFELTLDADAPENDPLEMVRRDGHELEGWKHAGEKVAGKQTRRFKLVGVGRCRNLNEVRQRLQQHGAVPEGQWREAFRTAYDASGSVGFADPSWMHPDGDARFPCVSRYGSSGFGWAGYGFGEDWRWLVAVGK